MPGFRGLGGFGRAAEADLAGYPLEEIPGAYFPDGNASIPRLLVRTLIPTVAPGGSMEDVVAARFDYARLDEPDSSVRIRLNSTAVRVEAQGERGVAVTYVRGGRAQRVRARNCVLACNNAMIPYLCPQLPEQQREALRFGVRCPLISTNVLLRDGRALERLGAAGFYCAGRMHSMVFAFGRSLGRYRYAWNPAEPVVLHMIATLAQPGTGVPPRDQYRRGQRRLYEMPFADLEREIRQHLAGMLGGAGFEPARDILAITVNRWPHGYAYGPMHLFDPDYAEGQAPHEIGRRRFGRIAIANSDAGGRALVDGAIDQAHRAVGELAKAQLI